MSVYRRVQFSANCHTQFGEHVYICGNIPQLGYWSPLKALKLTTDESCYPVWKSINPIYVMENYSVEFKIVIVTAESQFKWENISQNRIITPQIDAYIKLTANEFETYEIFPYCDGDEAVRTGMNVLNDLSSDASSSISFKSNYKFYQFFDQNGAQTMLKQENTSTYRDLKEYEDNKDKFKAEYEFVTYLDSLLELQDNQKTGKEIITSTQDCTKNVIQRDESHSLSSDKNDFDSETSSNDHRVTGTQNTLKNHRKKPKVEHNHKKLTSLNKIFYSNSSESLTLEKNE